jgi:hypothetical protein
MLLVPAVAGGAENASNPLAAVNNVDLRWQYESADPGDTHDVYVDGAHMLMPVLKLKYELLQFHFHQLQSQEDAAVEGGACSQRACR